MVKKLRLHLNRNDEIGEMATAIVKMNDELKKQDKAKEDMIHNISHDLKTPIAQLNPMQNLLKMESILMEHLKVVLMSFWTMHNALRTRYIPCYI